RAAVTKGISTSINTSPAVHSGASRQSFLYWRSCANKVFSIPSFPPVVISRAAQVLQHPAQAVHGGFLLPGRQAVAQLAFQRGGRLLHLAAPRRSALARTTRPPGTARR